MSNELTPLEALGIIKSAGTIYVGCASNIYTRYSFECNVIEKALKDYEWLKAMTTPLDKNAKKDIMSVAKRLKALEILKEWFEVFEDENGYHLRTLFDIGRIDKETFDLLKEVLK